MVILGRANPAGLKAALGHRRRRGQAAARSRMSTRPARPWRWAAGRRWCCRLRRLERENCGRWPPIGKSGAPDEIGRLQMTLRDESAHLDVRQRSMLLAVPGDVPLDVRLLTGHVTLLSSWGAIGGDGRGTQGPSCPNWPAGMASMWFLATSLVNRLYEPGPYSPPPHSNLSPCCGCEAPVYTAATEPKDPAHEIRDTE